MHRCFFTPPSAPTELYTYIFYNCISNLTIYACIYMLFKRILLHTRNFTLIKAGRTTPASQLGHAWPETNILTLLTGLRVYKHYKN